MTRPDAKRPYHVGVALGVTTTVYAVSLLVATRLQIAADRELIADRAPMQTAIELLDGHHDRLEARLAEARLRYTTGAAGYSSVAERIAALDERLAAVGRIVDDVEQLSVRLSTADLSVPTISRGSGGSSSRGGGTSSRGGGGGASGGNANGGGSSTVKLPPPPRAAPPPTSATTGASGG